MTYKELIDSIISAAEPVYGAREAAAIARLVAEKRYGLTRADLALTTHAELPPPRRVVGPVSTAKCAAVPACLAAPNCEKNFLHANERGGADETYFIHSGLTADGSDDSTAGEGRTAARAASTASDDGGMTAGNDAMVARSCETAAETRLSATVDGDFSRLIADLAAARPVQYILGVADFDGMELAVGEGVLIPRPETEELVEWIANDVIGRKSTGATRSKTGPATGRSVPETDGRFEAKTIGGAPESWSDGGSGPIAPRMVGGFETESTEDLEVEATRGSEPGTGGCFEAKTVGSSHQNTGFPGPISERPDTNFGHPSPISERPNPGRFTILDIGTGSGAIAIALAKRLPQARVEAIDVSPEALDFARFNNRHTGAGVVLLKGDIFDSMLETVLNPTGAKLYDVIVSNPPYIPDTECNNMAKNVTGHEPPLALFVPAADHLVFYRAIAKFAFRQLTPGGALYFEIFEKTAFDVIHLLEIEGFSNIELREDINSKPRMIKCLK